MYDEKLEIVIESCENNIICFASDFGQDLILNDSALEGANMDMAQIIKAVDVKKARELMKEAKRLRREHQYDDAITKLKEGGALIAKMKTTVEKMPEPESRGSKILSYFTPIFTLMPSNELTDVKVIPVIGSDGSLTFVLDFQYSRYTDKMSKETKSAVKRNLQYKFNLFLHNVDKFADAYKEEKRYYENAQAKKAAKKNKLVTV